MAARFNEPVFVISVAARLVEMHPQTLRKYEREGLIAPSRTAGNLRLYSDRDIERLRQVKHLVEKLGLNLAGVQLALELTSRLCQMREQAESLHQEATRNWSDRHAAEQLGQLRAHVDEMLRLLGLADGSDGAQHRVWRESGQRRILQ
jgi:MerR family transcriptional regulator/heat shock protein HspR